MACAAGSGGGFCRSRGIGYRELSPVPSSSATPFLQESAGGATCVGRNIHHPWPALGETAEDCGIARQDSTREQDDWQQLLSFVPSRWRDLAIGTRALKNHATTDRQKFSSESYLINQGCGWALRETALRPRRAKLADLESEALLQKLKDTRDCARAPCIELFRERGVHRASDDGFRDWKVDETPLTKPECLGRLWLIHCCMRLLSLACDFLELRERVAGHGRLLQHRPVSEGDLLGAGEGSSTANGIAYVAQATGAQSDADLGRPSSQFGGQGF